MKQVYETKESVESLGAKELVSTAVAGALAGVVVWVLSYVLNEYVVGRIACDLESSIVSCESASGVSAALALVLAGVVGLILLVRQRVFRPLLVVIASVASLWGIASSWLTGLEFSDFFLVVLVSALVYLVFTWFALIRNFAISFVAIVVLVVVFRLIINL